MQESLMLKLLNAARVSLAEARTKLARGRDGPYAAGMNVESSEMT